MKYTYVMVILLVSIFVAVPAYGVDLSKMMNSVFSLEGKATGMTIGGNDAFDFEILDSYNYAVLGSTRTPSASIAPIRADNQVYLNPVITNPPSPCTLTYTYAGVTTTKSCTEPFYNNWISIKPGTNVLSATANGITKTLSITGRQWTTPTGSITVSPSNPTPSQQVTFTATASDASGIAEIKMQIGNTFVKTCPPFSPSSTSTLFNCEYTGGPYSEGTYTYSAQVTSNDAIITSISGTPLKIADKTPRCSSGQMKGDANGDNKITQADDDIVIDVLYNRISTAGLSLCCMDMNGNGIIDAYDDSMITSIINGRATSPGTCTITTTDTLPPTITSSVSANDDTIAIISSATDSSGVAEMKIYVASGSMQGHGDYSIIKTCSSSSCSTDPVPFKTGNYVYKITAKDTKGNEGINEKEFNVPSTADKTPPAITSSVSYSSNILDLKSSATDLNGIKEMHIYVKKGSTSVFDRLCYYSPCNYYSAYTLTAGEYSYYVTAVDNNGRTSSDTKSFTVTSSACTSTTWSPDVSNKCGGPFTQTSNCGFVRTVNGGLTCTSPQTCGGGGIENVCGCKDGACITCTDSDGGTNVYVKGTAAGRAWVDNDNFTSMTDYCVALEGSPADLGRCTGRNCGVYEFDCVTLNWAADKPFVNGITISCPNGCYDGACIMNATNTTAPDLTITGFSVEPQNPRLSDNATFKIHIKNVGNEGCGSIKTLIDYGNSPDDEKNIKSITQSNYCIHYFSKEECLAKNNNNLSAIYFGPGAETDIYSRVSPLSRIYDESGTYTINVTVGCVQKSPWPLEENYDNNNFVTSVDVFDNDATICTDSDGGEDYYTKGTVSGYINGVKYSYSDSCSQPGDTNPLNEYVCTSDGFYTSLSYDCPNGCSDGACVNATNTTTASVSVNFDRDTATYNLDDGLIINVNITAPKNVIYNNGFKVKVGSIKITKPDRKIDIVYPFGTSSLDCNNLVPNVCSIIYSTKYSSTNTTGTYYVEPKISGLPNVIIPIEKFYVVSSCTDSDGGEDYYTKGTVSGYINGVKYSYSDSCSQPGDTNPLNEYVCTSDGFYTPLSYDCPNGCSDGACVSKKDTVKTIINNANINSELTDKTSNANLNGNDFCSLGTCIANYYSEVPNPENHDFTLQNTLRANCQDTYNGYTNAYYIRSACADTTNLNDAQKEIVKILNQAYVNSQLIRKSINNINGDTICRTDNICIATYYSEVPNPENHDFTLQNTIKTNCQDMYSGKTDDYYIQAVCVDGIHITSDQKDAIEYYAKVSPFESVYDTTTSQTNQTEILDLLMKFDALRAKLVDFANKADNLAAFYLSIGDDTMANKYRQVSAAFMESVKDIDDFKMFVSQNKDDIAAIREMAKSTLAKIQRNMEETINIMVSDSNNSNQGTILLKRAPSSDGSDPVGFGNLISCSGTGESTSRDMQFAVNIATMDAEFNCLNNVGCTQGVLTNRKRQINSLSHSGTGQNKIYSAKVTVTGTVKCY